ncbi:molybdenum cofactor guanylyltransferase MobA [Rhodoferax sp. GW822-FHT02A01]|uniref:molybdenum cofactor guanylyltransferase MobA n=1 Tax=Rhodoferax sp. GW822-FHT02A01 TaxID=3141537 RepID=UPI00315C9E4E
MQPTALDTRSVCAVVLAGGRATRMGGLDKGLQPFQGQPLAALALDRLCRQSAGTPGLLAINANRNLSEYQALGVPVWTDTVPDFAGPLAGFLAAMRQCESQFPYLLTVPCDSPRFPLDLLQRLGEALLQQQVPIAMAMAPDAQEADGILHAQPVFCLLRTALADKLQAFLESGGRKIGAWTASQGQAKVPFNAPGDDPRAFANANTLDDLHQLETR